MLRNGWILFALLGVLPGCEGDEHCRSWAGGNGMSSWGTCNDKREREVKCDVMPKPGAPPPAPGAAVECTCTLGGVVGKKFQMTDTLQLAEKGSALRTANEQCGWKLTLAGM